jgi:Mce-associated membrane protein
VAVDADSAGQLTEAEDQTTDGRPDVGQLPLNMRWPIVVGLVIVVAVAGLFGWQAYRAREARQAQEQRDLYLQVGRQAALNLTTISSNEADADVQRIIDSSVGSFHDDFAQRAPAFIEVVKKAQSTTEGAVTAAALESEAPDKAQVLVAVSVRTSNAGVPEQQPRAWRMRITVEKAADGAKVADVVFVP